MHPAAAWCAGAGVGLVAVFLPAGIHEILRDPAGGPFRSLWLVAVFFPAPGLIGACVGLFAGAAATRRSAAARGAVYGGLPGLLAFLLLAGMEATGASVDSGLFLLCTLAWCSGGLAGGTTAYLGLERP